LAKDKALEASKVPSAGMISAEFQAALARFRINVQRYWNATLVSPDVRKFLVHFLKILTQVSSKLNAAEGGAFIEKHARVLKPLAVVSEMTRTTKQLTEEQMVVLQQACTEFGDAYRESCEKLLTPKAHIIEVPVGPIVRRLTGWCGCTGEDGPEALHPWDTRCRLITRAMRNPMARLMATQKHLHAQQFKTPSKKRKASAPPPRTAASAASVEAASAAASAAAAAAAAVEAAAAKFPFGAGCRAGAAFG